MYAGPEEQDAAPLANRASDHVNDVIDFRVKRRELIHSISVSQVEWMVCRMSGAYGRMERRIPGQRSCTPRLPATATAAAAVPVAGHTDPAQVSGPHTGYRTAGWAAQIT